MNSMEENKIYKLEELSKDRGSYGIAASAVPFSNHKYTYLRITDINDDGTLKKDNLMSVDEKNASDFLLKKNDIVFARTGNSTGRSYFYDGSDGELVFAGFLIKFSIDENKVNPRILKYYTHSTVYYSWIRSFDTGGTRGNINAKTYGEMPIMLPSRKKQDRIVDILKSFDDKIELNNRINANLEEQAQALFRRWFVDFEFPNEQGLPYKSNGGKFVESELGKIPEGWTVGNISEIIESTLGGDWGKESKEGNYTRKVFCIRGADIPDIKKGTRGKMPIRYIIEKNFLNKSLESEDLVVEISGGSPTQSTGRVCRISTELLSKYKDSLICTNFCRAIKPTVGFSSYIFYLWEYLYSQGVMFTYENGTTGIKNLDMNRLIQKELIVIPNKNILKEFSILVNSNNKIIQSNGKESENLSSLRDSLLPQLMNNEFKI